MVSTCYLIPLAQLYNFNSCLHHQALKIDDWFRLSIYTIYVKKTIPKLIFNLIFIKEGKSITRPVTSVSNVWSSWPPRAPTCTGACCTAAPAMPCLPVPPPPQCLATPRSSSQQMRHSPALSVAEVSSRRKKWLKRGKFITKGIENAKMFLS